MADGSYRSQYRFGATNGRCGFRNPTARKNGLSFTSRSASTARAAIRPSARASSATSGLAYGGVAELSAPPFLAFGFGAALAFESADRAAPAGNDGADQDRASSLFPCPVWKILPKR